MQFTACYNKVATSKKIKDGAGKWKNKHPGSTCYKYRGICRTLVVAGWYVYYGPILLLVNALKYMFTVSTSIKHKLLRI